MNHCTGSLIFYTFCARDGSRCRATNRGQALYFVDPKLRGTASDVTRSQSQCSDTRLSTSKLQTRLHEQPTAYYPCRGEAVLHTLRLLPIAMCRNYTGNTGLANTLVVAAAPNSEFLQTVSSYTHAVYYKHFITRHTTNLQKCSHKVMFFDKHFQIIGERPKAGVLADRCLEKSLRRDLIS